MKTCLYYKKKCGIAFYDWYMRRRENNLYNKYNKYKILFMLRDNNPTSNDSTIYVYPSIIAKET